MGFVPDYTYGDPGDYLQQPIKEIIKYLIDSLKPNTYLKSRTIEGIARPTTFYDYDNIHSLKKIEGGYITPVMCIYPYSIARQQSLQNVEDKKFPIILIDTSIAASTYREACIQSTEFCEHLSTAIKYLKVWKRMTIVVTDQAILNPFMNKESEDEIAWRTKLEVIHI